MSEPKYFQIIDHPNLVRDRDTKAVLNTNVQAQEAYRKERAHRLKVKAMMEEFETVKSEISDIKMLLQKLVDKA